ncbi:SSRB-like protein [Mya arenaria]|uniref:SSRB-like protein n=1 Tax=Mya arenaria TaxID=6604 RepID=A0ABY7DRX8_MYAAR|nr:SSRB-like protein [Mya arenaria]
MVSSMNLFLRLSTIPDSEIFWRRTMSSTPLVLTLWLCQWYGCNTNNMAMKLILCPSFVQDKCGLNGNNMLMRMLSALVVVALCFVGSNLADDDGEARLLASKNILNHAAQNVKLTDDSFPEADFEVVAGNLKASWERIAPNTNVSHVVVLRPLKSGYFNFTAAEVSYSSGDNAGTVQTGYTSAPGEGGIVDFKEFNRRFSPHIVDWCVFAFMTLPSLGIPFLLWWSSKAKYDTAKPKRNI